MPKLKTSKQYDLEERTLNFAKNVQDFVMRVMISRKEAREAQYWLNLIEIKPEHKTNLEFLLKESVELRKIFGPIVVKSK